MPEYKKENIIKALKSHIVTHFSIVHHFPRTLYIFATLSFVEVYRSIS